jgi:hypothetical protein
MIKNKQPNQMEYTELITEAHEHKKGKVCTKCNKHQPLSEFYKIKNSKDGLTWSCKSCLKKQKDNMCRFKRWWESKKSHAKEKGIVLTIEPIDIPGVKIGETITIDRRGYKRRSWAAIEYPKVCSKWGIELDWGMNGLQWNSPSLDRIDPTKGYIPGNVILVCNSYNSAKSNCPPDEWDVIEKKMARFVLFG